MITPMMGARGQFFQHVIWVSLELEGVVFFDFVRLPSFP